MRSEPKFYLKDNKTNNKTPIILNLKVHNKTFRYSTQKSIFPNLWDKTTQKPTKNRKLINGYKKEIPTLKEDLKDIENRIINLDKSVRLFLNQVEQQNKTIDFTELKNHLDNQYKKVINNKGQKPEFTLNEYIDYFLNGIETGSITINSGSNFGKKYAKSSIKALKEWKTQFINYQNDNRKLNWDDIDLKFYNNFLSYCYEKGYSVNYVGRLIKHLKSILRRGFDNGYHNNTIFESKDFRVVKEKVDSVRLTEEEVEKLRKLDLSNNKSYDLHRDIFLMCCYTALRISDIKRLKKEHFYIENKKMFIKIRMKKSIKPVIIPIKSELKPILEKYNYNIPSVYESILGRDMKEICKLAEINTPTEHKKSNGGKIEYITKPKYEWVSSHTGRRTGATLMAKSGLHLSLIKEITGHGEITTLMNYIGYTQQEIANTIAEHPYFK